MKNQFIKKLEDMPAWFSHDSYSVFDDFSFEELYKEIQLRTSIDSAIGYFQRNKGVYKSIKEHNAFEWHAYNSILSGLPMLSKLSPDNGENFECFSSEDALIDSQLSFYHNNGVRMMGAGELRHLHGKLVETCGPSEHVGDFNLDLLDVKRFLLPVAHLLRDADVYSSHQVPVVIDLASFTDREIISGIEVMLKSMRKQLCAIEPDKSRVWASDSRKILTYKVLQTLDLKLWQKYEGIKIKKSVLIVALYPNGERGEVEFDATVSPFIKKLTSGNVVLPTK
jgi:uncharacterized protein DUF6387